MQFYTSLLGVFMAITALTTAAPMSEKITTETADLEKRGVCNNDNSPRGGAISLHISSS